MALPKVKKPETVLEHILEHHSMPGQIWNGGMFGPISFDDPFEISFWYKESKDGEPKHFRIKLKIEEIKQGL